MIAQSIANGLVLGSIYVLVALGLTLVFSICKILNFAHGEFYMLGAFGIYYLFGQLGLHYVLALVLTMLVVGLLGGLVERIFFRRFAGQFHAPIVISLGLSMVLSSGAWLVFGGVDKGISTPFSGVVNILGVTIPLERLAVICVSAPLVIAFYLLLQRSKVGQAMEAVAQDREAATVLGIDADRSFSLSFCIGSALAGAAGVLVGPIFVINPFLGSEALFKAIAVIILGGMGSVVGSVCGGLFLGISEAFLATYVGVRAQMIGFVLIIVVLLLRPKGFFGRE